MVAQDNLDFYERVIGPMMGRKSEKNNLTDAQLRERLFAAIDLNGKAYTGIDPDILKSYFCSIFVKNRNNTTMEIVGEITTLFTQYQTGMAMLDYLERPTLPEIETINKSADFLKQIGTAQGSPLSPYLSAICLQEIAEGLPKGVYVIMYADDMIFYGPNLLDWIKDGDALILYLQSLGFTLNVEKSGWVKLGGLWRKPLKFLGIEYDGLNRVLKASTRKGSDLVLNQTIIELLNAEFDINYAISKT